MGLALFACTAASQGQTYTFSTLYNFKSNGTDPVAPLAAPILDASGNIYGTSSSGGVMNQGAVFKVSPEGELTVLHSFGKGADTGGYLVTSLARDQAGNLYGTTPSTVFKLAPSGDETFLFTFPTGQKPVRHPVSVLLLLAMSGWFPARLTGRGGRRRKHLRHRDI